MRHNRRAGRAKRAGGMDFRTWFNAGSYGGLILCLLTALGISGYTLGLHRGTRRQQARASLLCLVACALMLAAIFWSQHRLDILGPKLPVYEVAFWLVWTALAGWSAPVWLAVLYLMRAAPQPVTASLRVPAIVRRV